MPSKSNKKSRRQAGRQPQSASSHPREEIVYAPDGKPTQKHLYRKLKSSTLKPAAVILLHDEDESTAAMEQTAFDEAEGLDIEGGFYGINSPTAALEYTELQLNHARQMAQDRTQEALQKEQIAFQREQIALERERLQLEREKLRADQAQYMSKLYSTPEVPNTPTAECNPPSYSQASSEVSSGHVPSFPGPMSTPPASPPFPQALADSKHRSAPAFTNDDSMTRKSETRLNGQHSTDLPRPRVKMHDLMAALTV